MKMPTKAITPLALALLIAAGGLSACTAEEEPAPSTTDAAPSQTVDPNEPDALLTLITNVGTREAPVGASKAPGSTSSTLAYLMGGGEAVFFESDALDLPGGNGQNQIYRWTPELGISLITNVGTDPTTPQGASGFSMLSDASDDGSAAVFISQATDLVDGNGQGQIYLWTVADGLVRIFNTQITEGPDGQHRRWDAYDPYEPTITDDGVVEFYSVDAYSSGTSRVYDHTMYRWTTTDGLALIGHIAVPDPVGKADAKLARIGRDGAAVFCSDSLSLPGGNGFTQIYRATVSGELTLITNVGTLDNPVGMGSELWGLPQYTLGDGGSILFEYDAVDLPGGNGRTQVYLWTPQDGITLISNVGMPASPVGANGLSYGSAFASDHSGAVAFTSNASDFAQSSGLFQIYLWTAANGVSRLTDFGSAEIPEDTYGAVLISSFNSPSAMLLWSLTNYPLAGEAVPPQCVAARQVYLWTASDGVSLVTNAGTAANPVGSCDGGSEPILLGDGSVVFSSSAPDLPGANGDTQIYRWTPPE